MDLIITTALSISIIAILTAMATDAMTAFCRKRSLKAGNILAKGRITAPMNAIMNGPGSPLAIVVREGAMLIPVLATATRGGSIGITGLPSSMRAGLPSIIECMLILARISATSARLSVHRLILLALRPGARAINNLPQSQRA